MQKLLSYNRWILILMVIASAVCAGGITKLEVSHNMDEYFSASGEDLQIYHQYRDIFGDDDQFLLVSIESAADIYGETFIRDLKSVKENLRAFPEIDQVLWIDDWLPDTLTLTQELIESIAERHLFVSEDHAFVSLLIQHETINDKKVIASLIDRIKEGMAPFDTQQIRLAGKTYFTTILEKFMREDSGSLFIATLCLVLVILYLMLGSIRLLLLSLTVPVLSIAFTLGLMGRLGLHINLFTTMVPTLILIISVSDVIHIVKGAGPAGGRERVLYHFAALLLTSVTTAIGFASLLTTSIQAIMEFGGFVAVGVMYTFLLTITLFSMIPLEAYKQQSITDKILDQMIEGIRAYYDKRAVQFITLIGFAALILIGINKTQTNAYLISGIPDDSEIRQNSYHFDRTFAGTRPLSIFIKKQDTALSIPAPVFPRLDSLIKVYFSPRFLVGPRADSRFESNQMKVASDDRQYLRFYGLINDVGSQVATRRYDSLSNVIEADPVFDGLTVNYTGISRMVDKNTTDTASSIMIGLFAALGVTFILLSFYFRGVGEAFISIIVNVIPLLVLASIYGFLGIELRAGTSVAFSIAFGIAIDDTMHMLATYKKHKTSGIHFDQVVIDSGKPILMTTLVFGISFSVLTFSGLEAISVLGFSMVIGCISALISDLVILPAMLRMINRIPIMNPQKL